MDSSSYYNLLLFLLYLTNRPEDKVSHLSLLPIPVREFFADLQGKTQSVMHVVSLIFQPIRSFEAGFHSEAVGKLMEFMGVSQSTVFEGVTPKYN